jgi:hypothetical protein
MLFDENFQKSEFGCPGVEVRKEISLRMPVAFLILVYSSSNATPTQPKPALIASTGDISIV